jgi:hypothetical protein
MTADNRPLFDTTGKPSTALDQPGIPHTAAEMPAVEARVAAQEAAARAQEIHGALDARAQSRRTTAVLQTEEGVSIIAGGGRDLDPKQRSMLQSNEVAAKAPGAHAEVTALQHAAEAGLTPQVMSTTRPICTNCSSEIQRSGGTLTSPTTATWPPATGGK